MGTSKNYTAPTSSGSGWDKLKSQVTRSVSGGGISIPSAKSILKDYITVNGGVKKLAAGGGVSAGSKSAQNVATKIGGFIADIGNLGVKEAFKTAGLSNLEGKSVSEITNFLFDLLGGPSNTVNDVDARKAILDLTNELFSEADNLEDIEKILDNIVTANALNNLLIKYFGYYLFEQFCRCFYERLTKRKGIDEADNSIKNISDYIKESLKNKLFSKDIRNVDWAGTEGKKIATEILEETLEVFSQ